ncbi:MAG: hypothetical protein ABI743_00270, partial [bacterium]
MARFHMGVETALDPFTAKALRELPDHYHVCVGFNVPRTTRMAEALVLRLAGDQSALFMIGTLHLDAAVRGSAHGPWEIAVEEDGELYWDPYDTPLGDTNPLLGLQYTANKAQDWIAANLPMLEDPLHPWGSEVRPQVFPRLLIVSEQPVEVERHSWVWYFTEAQQLVEHLEAWRPRDPFPITPHVLRKLVQAFNLTPEEAWDERPLDISTEAVRDIQREWASLGEEIRTLRNVLNEAQEALGAIRSRGRLVDEALRHLIAGLEEKTASDRARAAAQEMDDDQDDYEEEPEPPPTPKRRPRVAAAPEPEPEPEPPKPARKTRAAKVIEAAPLDEDDEPEPEPEAPKPRRRVLKAEAAPAPAAAVETAPVRRRRTATTDSAEDLPLRGQVSAAGGYEQSTGTTSWEDEAPPAPPPPVVIVHAEADEELPKLVQEPVTIGTATLHVRERQTPTAPATPIIRERPTPIATPTT